VVVGTEDDGRPILCGLAEFDKDKPAKMVPIYPTYTPAPVETVAAPQVFTLPGCASGNCPTTVRGGWYLGKNLGR
jgi:hypothetical protein